MMILLNIADGEDKNSILANRLRKNYRHIRKWAKRTHTDCFRIYDREIANFPIVIDYYAGRFCVQYFAKNKDLSEPSPELIHETDKALNLVFGIQSSAVYWRTRSKSKKTRQYEKIGESGAFFTVFEYGVKFKINLEDYLDTGLFLDHRETRQIVAKHSKGKRLLNLFSYTCSFSVHAAMAGALFTKSVDLSNTYSKWGKENFDLNSISSNEHLILRADCLKFLDQERLKGLKYDLVVIDPPTISRSKKMEQLFDIQIDYVTIIQKALKLLTQDGIIYFSTNSRKFSFDFSLFPSCQIEEITHRTHPFDFRDPKIHRCWKITYTATLAR